MAGAVEIVKEEPETAPVEARSQLPAQSDVWSETDALIDEFNQKTATPEPEPEQLPASETDAAPESELDRLLADLSAPSADQQRADGLQSQLNELQIQVHREREIAAYHAMADDLEKTVQEIAPHVPDGWTKLMMDSFAHNEEITLAFDYRGIDPKAAALDLANVQVQLRRLQADPNADRAQIQQLAQLAYRLDIAARSPAILRQCRNEILSEARKMKPPIDVEASLDRAAISQAIRDGSAPIIPEAPIRWGNLSAREGRERVKRDFGFDPGWGW